MQFTLDQISEMAPDAASAAAGKKLMVPRHWKDLGQSTAALWGLCQGSAVYQVKVDFSNLGYHCSCPSRKFPCKHVLGLLMLYAASPEAVSAADTPAWVADWLARREEKAAKKTQREQEKRDKPADEKAQRQRAEQREARVREGLERFDLWLRDLVRNGLAGLETRPPSFWAEQSKRLVDAQAPGLAARVDRLATIPGSSRDWPRRLLCELGRLKLAIHAYARIRDLNPALQSDLRQLLGWTVSQEELERDGERVEDQWVTFGQWVDEEERVRTQRSWAVGRRSNYTALLLQFSVAGQPFPELIVPGSEQRGTLAFYPGAGRQRAKFLNRDGAAAEVTEQIPGFAAIEAFLCSVAEQLGRQPWLTSFGGVLHDVTLVVSEGAWLVCDARGDALQLAGREHWRLLAMTGGHPFDLTGEWDGHRFRPLGMYLGDKFWVV